MKQWKAVVLFWAALGAALGAQLGTVPFTFNPGTPIQSAEMNTNFSTAYALALNRQAGVMTGTLTTLTVNPITTNDYDLGTSLLRYRDAWLARDIGVGGNLSITGTIFDPNSPVQIGDNFQVMSATSPQLTLSYDTQNELRVSVGSNGVVTFNAVGSGASFAFSDPITGVGSIEESSIVDGTILARVAGNEGITGNWTFAGALSMVSAAPAMLFHAASGAANEKRWYLYDSGATFSVGLQDDAGNNTSSALLFSRSGGTPTGMTVYTPISAAHAAPAMTYIEQDAPVDEKVWQWRPVDGDFYLTLLNDGMGPITNALRIIRNGTAPSGLALESTPRIYVPPGAAPAYTFWGDEDTGMFNPAANDLRLVAATAYLQVTPGIIIAGAAPFRATHAATFDAGVTMGPLTSGSISATGTITSSAGITASTSSITAATGAVVAGNGMFMADGQARFRATAAGGGGAVAIERMADDGTLISFERNGAGVGSVTVAGGVVAYNTFLGSHYVQVKGQVQEGEVVISTGDAIGNRFVYVEASTKRNQPGVYGVLLGPTTVERRTWGDLTKPVFQVAGLGQFQVWVTDTCGEIRNGDLLAASPRRGLAERQCTDDGKPDNVVRSTTLGKALVNVTWDGVRRKRIPVVLMTG